MVSEEKANLKRFAYLHKAILQLPENDLITEMEKPVIARG